MSTLLVQKKIHVKGDKTAAKDGFNQDSGEESPSQAPQMLPQPQQLPSGHPKGSPAHFSKVKASDAFRVGWGGGEQQV